MNEKAETIKNALDEYKDLEDSKRPYIKTLSSLNDDIVEYLLAKLPEGDPATWAEIASHIVNLVMIREGDLLHERDCEWKDWARKVEIGQNRCGNEPSISEKRKAIGRYCKSKDDCGYCIFDDECLGTCYHSNIDREKVNYWYSRLKKEGLL